MSSWLELYCSELSTDKLSSNELPSYENPLTEFSAADALELPQWLSSLPECRALSGRGCSGTAQVPSEVRYFEAQSLSSALGPFAQ